MEAVFGAGTSVGRYHLESLLGAGGMAEVWKVNDEILNRPVALKIVLPKLLDEPEFVARFLREARVAACLDHPNIPQIFDVGTFEGRPYIVVPILPGGTLAERLRKRVSFEDGISWLAQLAAALDYAHLQSIVHRDVKPANALFDKNDRLYLTDFGLAKSLKEGPGLTLTGVLVGTPAFMSPEQASGASVGPASDQYSLGVIAYQVLTGRLPFDKPLSPIVIHQILNEQMPAPSSFRKELPSVVDRVMGKVMSKTPAERFMSCTEFVRALGIALEPERPHPGPPKPETDTEPVSVDFSAMETGVEPPKTEAAPRRRKRPPTTETALPPKDSVVAPADIPTPTLDPGSFVQKFRVIPPGSTDKLVIFEGQSHVSEPSPPVPLLTPEPEKDQPAHNRRASDRAPLVTPAPEEKAETAAVPQPSTAVAAPEGQAPAKRNPLVWAGIAAAVLVVAIVAFLALRPRPDGAESPKPAPTPISAESEGATQQGSETQVSTSPPSVEAGPLSPSTAASEASTPGAQSTPIPAVIPAGALLESTSVVVSDDVYLFIFSFDRTFPKPKQKDVEVTAIKVLSRGSKDLVSQTPKPSGYRLELRGAVGNTLSYALKVATTDFKGENVLMTGDTLRLEWTAPGPFRQPTAFALVSSRR